MADRKEVWCVLRPWLCKCDEDTNQDRSRPDARRIRGSGRIDGRIIRSLDRGLCVWRNRRAFDFWADGALFALHAFASEDDEQGQLRSETGKGV